MKKIILLSGLLTALVLTSCGGKSFMSLLKSNDNELKLQQAREYYQQKNYSRSLMLLENISPYFRGTEKAQEILYLTARCYFGQKDYYTAAHQFESYAKLYPREMFAVESKFMVGYCYYLESPDPKLDQQLTQKGVTAFQSFLELYSNSQYAVDALRYMDELNDKLAKKELISAQLYYNMGIYLGNNYRAAAITAENAIKNFPRTDYREEFELLILKSKYKQAEVSVHAKQAERYEEASEAYQAYIADFPDGKHLKEAQKLNTEIEKYLK